MGQKAHPRGFRLSFHKDHYLSSWFASNSGHLFSSPSYTDDKIQKQLAVMTVENDQSKVDTAGSGNADAASRVRIDTPSKGQVDHLAKKNLYSLFVYEDFLIREFFYKELQITNVIIKRKQKTLTIHLEANLNAMSNLMRSCEAASSQNKGKVGVSTDQDRAESTASSSKLRYLETLKIKLTKLLKKKTDSEYLISFKLLNLPLFSAQSLSLKLKNQLENRSPYKKSMKTLVREAKKAGVKGIKIKVSGRLNGAEMARSESESFGKLPLQTIRIPIDYYYTQAYTIFGILGIKIWVYS